MSGAVRLAFGFFSAVGLLRYVLHNSSVVVLDNWMAMRVVGNICEVWINEVCVYTPPMSVRPTVARWRRSGRRYRGALLIEVYSISLFARHCDGLGGGALSVRYNRFRWTICLHLDYHGISDQEV